MPGKVRTAVIVGCGVIGMSWGVLFLSRGIKVIISDTAEGAESNFQQYILYAKAFFEGHGDFESLSRNYEFVSDVTSRLPEADFVQEVTPPDSDSTEPSAVIKEASLTRIALTQNGPERLDLKQQLMETLDEHTRPDVVIASSSSGLPSSAFIQRCKKNPNRILVGHPFNPPHLIPLVEIVPHPDTSQESISMAMALYRSLGKRPILLNHEVPGFVSNRLQAAINNEAYSLISRGIVSAADLDTAVASGPGLRWAITGPIATNALGGGGGCNGGGMPLGLARVKPRVD